MDLAVSFYVLMIALVLSGGAVDYSAIWDRVDRRAKCPDGARNTASLFATDCYGVKIVDVQRLRHMPPTVAAILAFCLLLWLWAALRAVGGVPQLLKTREFYRDKLGIDGDAALHAAEWEVIMKRLVATSGKTHLQIVHCITRYADFETAMLNDGILKVGLSLPFGLGVVPYFPASFQANLRRAVTEAIEIPQYGDVGDTAAQLAWKLRALAALNVALAPGLLVYRLANYAFRYVEEWRRRPSVLATRQWSPWSRARLRQFAELDERLDARLLEAHPLAATYVQSMATAATSPLTTIAARGTATVFGGMLTLMIGFTMVYDEAFLAIDFSPGRSVAFWTGVVGLVMAAALSVVPEPSSEAPDDALHKLAKALRHAPPGWQSNANAMATHADVLQLFPYRAVVLATELLSVVLTPWMLWRAANDAGDIARYLADNTIVCRVAGPICRLAAFNAPTSTSTRAATSKVELSLLQFKEDYKAWRPETEWQNSVVLEREDVMMRSLGSVELNEM